MNISDKPREMPCPSCGEPILAALRDGVFEAVRVDPVSLTTLGELQALTTGRRTFEHWGRQGGGLDARRPDAIRRWPAGDPWFPIRPEHRCGVDPPDHLVEQPQSVHYDQPPF